MKRKHWRPAPKILKPHAGMNPDLHKLKQLWIHSFTAEDRKFWRERFASTTPQTELRAELLARYQVTWPVTRG